MSKQYSVKLTEDQIQALIEMSKYEVQLFSESISNMPLWKTGTLHSTEITDIIHHAKDITSRAQVLDILHKAISKGKK